MYYDETQSTTNYYRFSGTSQNPVEETISASSVYITSITDTGFSLGKTLAPLNNKYSYIAVG